PTSRSRGTTTGTTHGSGLTWRRPAWIPRRRGSRGQHRRDGREPRTLGFAARRHSPPHEYLDASVFLVVQKKFCSTSYGGNGLFDECHFSNTTHEDATFMLWNFFEYYSSHEVGKGRPEKHDRQFFDKTAGANGLNLTNYDVSYTAYSSKTPHRLVLLAGSTVHFDRGFLVTHFPALKRFLNHKNVDVTTLLETAKRFRPDILEHKPKPSATHRALDDILDSINLYRFFREEVFDKI
ncbi:unnamed protein product, partial [Sphacelaria rigidula]